MEVKFVGERSGGCERVMGPLATWAKFEWTRSAFVCEAGIRVLIAQHMQTGGHT